MVLQDAGGASLEASEAALDVLLPLIEENGAEPLLYMRYSDKRDDDARVARDLQGDRAPVRADELIVRHWPM